MIDKKNLKLVPWLFVLFSFLVLTFLPPVRFFNLFKRKEINRETLFSFLSQEDIKHNAHVEVSFNNVTKDHDGTLWLDSEKDAYFSVLLPPYQGKTITLSVDCYTVGNKAKQNLLLVIPSINKTIVLSALSSLRHRTFDITPYLVPNEPFLLGIVPKSNTGNIVIEKILVREMESADALPLLDVLFVFIVFIFFFTDSLVKMYNNTVLPYAAGICALFVFVIVLFLPLSPLIFSWYWFFLLLFLLTYRMWIFHKLDRALMIREWFLAIFSLGFILRWRSMSNAFGQPLTGDAPGYKDMALSFLWQEPFATGIREPFYIWLQSIGAYLFGPNNYQFRLMTFILSLGIVYLTYQLAKRISGSESVGLLSSFLIAINHYSVFSSAQGERIELFIFLMLLYCNILLANKRSNLISEIKAAACAGFICLTWLYGIMGVVCLYFISLFFKRISFKNSIIGILLFLIIVGSLLFFHWKEYGDPFIALNAHANFYRNAELTGDPAYTEGPGSWVGYLLRERGLFIITYRTFIGYIKLFFNPLNPFNKIFLGFHYSLIYSYFLFPFYLLGVFLALKKKQVWIFGCIISFTNVSPYFIDLFRDPRLLFFVAPFVAYFWGVGVEFCIIQFYHMVKNFRI